MSEKIHLKSQIVLRLVYSSAHQRHHTAFRDLRQTAHRYFEVLTSSVEKVGERHNNNKKKR